MLRACIITRSSNLMTRTCTVNVEFLVDLAQILSLKNDGERLFCISRKNTYNNKMWLLSDNPTEIQFSRTETDFRHIFHYTF